MDYKREVIKNEIDTIYISEKEFQAANEIFKQALRTKYPSIDVTNLRYSTLILTDGLYRSEFTVKTVGDKH